MWLLIIQRQTDLRSSAAAAKEKQERWRSSIRATGRTHERQLLGRIARGEDRSSEFGWFIFCFLSPLVPHFQEISPGLCEKVGVVDHGIEFGEPRE